MTIRVAIIGAGIMGGDHARIFAGDIPGASLQVICDVDEDAARRIADNCSAQSVETDAVKTIGRDDVDAVVIASPDDTHADLCRQAMSLGKPVLCEKPLGVTAAECLAVVEAEIAIGRQLLQVGFMRRFDAGYAGMQQALQDGRIGHAVMMHNFHRNVEAPNAEFTAMMAITNSAPHEFDAVRFVLSSEVTAVAAFEPGLQTGGVCKPVVMVLDTADGQLVTVEVNNTAAYGYDVRGELIGSHGTASLGESPVLRVDAALSSCTAYAADWRPRFADAYRRQNQAWIAAIASGTPSAIAANTWDGYCASVIAEAGVQALASGRKVPVQLAQRPPLYRP